MRQYNVKPRRGLFNDGKDWYRAEEKWAELNRERISLEKFYLDFLSNHARGRPELKSFLRRAGLLDIIVATYQMRGGRRFSR
jgi:hypothetical protein